VGGTSTHLSGDGAPLKRSRIYLFVGRRGAAEGNTESAYVRAARAGGVTPQTDTSDCTSDWAHPWMITVRRVRRSLATRSSPGAARPRQMDMITKSLHLSVLPRLGDSGTCCAGVGHNRRALGVAGYFGSNYGWELSITLKSMSRTGCPSYSCSYVIWRIDRLLTQAEIISG